MKKKRRLRVERLVEFTVLLYAVALVSIIIAFVTVKVQFLMAGGAVFAFSIPFSEAVAYRVYESRK